MELTNSLDNNINLSNDVSIEKTKRIYGDYIWKGY